MMFSHNYGSRWHFCTRVQQTNEHAIISCVEKCAKCRLLVAQARSLSLYLAAGRCSETLSLLTEAFHDMFLAAFLSASSKCPHLLHQKRPRLYRLLRPV